MAKKTKKKEITIDTWVPTSGKQYVDNDGSLFVVKFDKILNEEKLSVYNKFIMNRSVYIKQLPVIVNYINYFINFYDDDNELIVSYLRVKYALDHMKTYNESNMDSYIKFLYETIITDTLVEKIKRLTEDNYHQDIEGDSESKKKYQRNKKKYIESLEFTNKHVKILLSISIAMKILAPAIFHYLSICNIAVTKDDNTLYRFFKDLFDIFGYDNNEFEIRNADNENIGTVNRETVMKELEIGNIHRIYVPYNKEVYHEDVTGNNYVLSRVDMYTKLFVYVKAKVMESQANNSIIFDQKEIMGKDINWVIRNFTRSMIIGSIIFKYRFDLSIIGFNKTVIKLQLSYFLKEQYKRTLIEVTDNKNSDELSGADKMLMNLTKLDEGITTMADINIELTIDRIREMNDIPISEEEIAYYMKHHAPSEVQRQLVYSYYTRYFGSYRDLNLLNNRDYTILLLILKKKLLIELGYETDLDGSVHHAALPYILSGNLEDKLNTRIIRNNKFISKIKDSYLYKNLVETKYYLLQEIKPDYILSILSTVINSRFTYVTYENKNLTGTDIIYSEDKIADELLFFLNGI